MSFETQTLLSRRASLVFLTWRDLHYSFNKTLFFSFVGYGSNSEGPDSTCSFLRGQSSLFLGRISFSDIARLLSFHVCILCVLPVLMGSFEFDLSISILRGSWLSAFI